MQQVGECIEALDTDWELTLRTYLSMTPELERADIIAWLSREIDAWLEDSGLGNLKYQAN
jgi:hypothetical protein